MQSVFTFLLDTELTMEDPNIPLLADMRHFFELPNGHFVKIDLRPNANQEYVVEHLDDNGEFIAGLQIPAPESYDPT